MINTPEFRAAIARSGRTNRELAKSLGLSETAFYNKKNGRTEFRLGEIKKLVDLLALSASSAEAIFFGGLNT